MLRILFALFVTFSLWFTHAWAVQDNQETVCDRTDILVCDNFEARTTGSWGPTYKNNGWEVLGAPSVVTTVVRDGVRSQQWQYVSGANTGSGYALLHFINTAPDVYFRWYTQWSQGFRWSTISTKHNEAYTIGGHGVHLFQHIFGDDAITVTFGITPPWWTQGLGPGQPDAYHLYQQQNVVHFQGGQWYCIEVRLRMNSGPSTADGVVQAWIDGVPVMNYPNLILDRETDSSLRRWGSFFVSSYWNCGGGASEGPTGQCEPPNAESTHPTMFRWHDNFVAATQPIGCLNSPPPAADIAPPASPQNLIISSLWERLLKNFWTLQ